MEDTDHVFTIANASIVDIIINNAKPNYIPEGVTHPFHLHGHDFWVLGSSDFSVPSDPNKLTAWPEDLVLRAERCGHALDAGDNCAYSATYDYAKLNFVNPPVRDTTLAPGGGWVYLRFYANNPGVWFFHCHIGGHMEQGMRVAFNVMPWSQPDLPDDFRECGLCRSDACDYCSSSSSGGSSSTSCSSCSSSTSGPVVTNTVNVNFANMFNGLTLS